MVKALRATSTPERSIPKVASNLKVCRMHTKRLRAAFTLIEIMAVVILLGIMASIALPALQTKTIHGLHTQADALVAVLELARTRAAMSGNTQRVHLQLNHVEAENRNQDIADLYFIEWVAPNIENAMSNLEQKNDAATFARSRKDSVQLIPPSHASLEAEYRPIPGQFGRPQALEREVFIAAVETPDGIYAQGSLYIYFYSDGSADPLQIVLGNNAGHRLRLEVQALADAIRITEEN